MAHPYDHLNSVLASMPQAVFVKDAQSRIVMMNAACEALWGVRFEEVAGTDCSGRVPPEQLRAYHACDRRAFDTGQVVVVEEPCSPTGLNETRWLLTHKRALYDRAGKPHLLIGSCADITERKRKEAALEDALRRTREITGHQFSAMEEHRRRLALDAHDNLAQNLAALKLDIVMLHARTGDHQPLLHARAARALDTLNASISQVREIINQLHPSTLELGLSAAIEWQLQQLGKRHGLDCRLLVREDSATLSPQYASALFHVVRAGLHYLCASASSVLVELSLRRERLAITLHSNRPDPTPGAEEALPLQAMRERLSALGGVLHIHPRSLHISVTT
ncbi:PAS domain S-box-containing protein [Duganella sp. SG902]|uniref:PAS domain-containing sensor histidine kinase n=1 Tax=Duganella sp. SG902 TaxID=2587016 RepID=UPI00159D336B|nr:PAS domain-containing protein [Duganella sp. SG902]NVM79185.1 PAS domain S-box-containing protein [Duganella sp. SG902]